MSELAVKYVAKRLEADEITQEVRDQYRGLLRDELSSGVRGINHEMATEMAFKNTRNSLDAMRRTAEDPLLADYYEVRCPGAERVVLAMGKIGTELYGDRPDLGRIRYGLARVAHLAGMTNESTMQIFGYGALPTLLSRPDDNQAVFKAMIETAAADHPNARHLSAFIDHGDEALLARMASLSNSPIRRSKKIVDIDMAGISRKYSRAVIDIPRTDR